VHAADDELQRAVGVVVERDVLVRRGHALAVDAVQADDADDAAVVADERVRVARVRVGDDRAGQAAGTRARVVVAPAAGARAAEQQVGTVGPEVGAVAAGRVHRVVGGVEAEEV
jgi:hypothetical protein